MTTPAAKVARSRRHFAVVGVCLALVYAFGVFSLKSYPATHEEWDSVKHLADSQLSPIYSIPETVESVIQKTNQDHAPGYLVLLNFWSRLAGLDLFVMRLFSVLIALFGLVFTYRLTLLAGGQNTAMDAVLLATFVGFVAYYTHAARMYSLLATLSIVVVWSYWKISSIAGVVPRRLWLAFIAASAALLWVHYFGTIVLAAVGIYHVFFAFKDRRWIWSWLALIGAGLLFMPWLPVFLEGLLTRDVPTSDALSFVDSLLAIASIYTNGLPFVAAIVGIAVAARYKRLNRSQRYSLIVVCLIALLMLLGNEIAPLLIARRIRYTIVLALPWVCALAIGLNQIPRWRLFRNPFLILWIAAYVGFSRSEELLLYNNWLGLSLQKSPPYQELLYEPGIDIEHGDYIVSFHSDTPVDKQVFAYYDRFAGEWSGMIHLRASGDGEPSLQSTARRYSTLDSMASWRFRAWLVYNPAQTDLQTISAYTEGFLQYYKPCGRFVDKPEAVIELYGPKRIECALLTSSELHATSVRYDNGSELRKVDFELDADELTVATWWSLTVRGMYAYTLQLFDEDGNKTGPQIDTVITDAGLYQDRLDIASLPAGEYDLRLILYNYETLDSQPGIITGSQHRVQRELQIDGFTVGA